MGQALLRTLRRVALAAGLAWLGTSAGVHAGPVVDVQRVMQVAATKLAAHDDGTADKTHYPNQAESSSPVSTWETIAPSNWVSGFYPGALWQMYEFTGDASWRARAETWTAGIESQKTNTSTHDVGFMINNSFGQGYRLTGNTAYRDVVLTAAESLSQRYNPSVGSIRSWYNLNATEHYHVIIDTMMNLELLFWASKNGGQAHNGTASDLYNLAVSHADRTIMNHVRADGSTFHVVNYSQDGTIKERYTAQGKSVDTTWSRGQAWGIYGFTLTYRETSEPRFLETARSLADYFLSNLPDNEWVPPADFDSEHTSLAHKDSTAAAITASGLFELSELETDPVRKQRYWDAAVHMLDALTAEDSAYFSDSLTESPGLLLHGSRRYQPVNGDDKTYIWGDYYLIEATTRYANATAVPEPSSSLLLMLALGLIALNRTRTSPTQG